MSKQFPNVPPSHELRGWKSAITPNPLGEPVIAVAPTFLELRTGIEQESPPFVVHPAVARDVAMQMLAQVQRIEAMKATPKSQQ